jgi:hypothetical protein
MNGVITSDAGPTTACTVGLVSNGQYIWGPEYLYTWVPISYNVPNPYAGYPVSIVLTGPASICAHVNYQTSYIHP